MAKTNQSLQPGTELSRQVEHFRQTRPMLNTPVKMAKKLDVDVGEYKALVRGDVEFVSGKLLDNVAKLLQITPDEARELLEQPPQQMEVTLHGKPGSGKAPTPER